MQMGAQVNVDAYRKRLRNEEQELVARIERMREGARGAGDAETRDAGDESLREELRSEQWTEAAVDSSQLTEVRDALARIESGTFGTCAVDGQPIEEKRLDAMPWTRYCLKHQAELEAAAPTRTPTM
jgi:DnaK suppressor protein